jgi:FdhE protein
MTAAQPGAPDYGARIRRAQHLGALHPFAAEVLSFYGHLATFQQRLYKQLSQHGDNQPLLGPNDGLRSELNLAALLQYFPELLSLLQSVGPAPVAEAARQLSLQGPAAWITFLTVYWGAGGSVKHPAALEPQQPPDRAAEALTDFALRVFLQPYAEFLVVNRPPPHLDGTQRVCGLCGSAPLLGVLRPEGDAGKRRLVCSFCLNEWDFRRILCPACGEEAEDKLPVYVAEQFPHIRVESCDTCRFYIRTIDLTKDGHAVPIVDDLAAIPLSLWAHEHNYSRLQSNLLGT